MFAKFASIVAAAAVVFLTSSLHAETIFYGPTPYLSAADSPFDLSGLGTTFWLEDFEDGALNTPGVSTRSGYYVTEPEFATDSVDADDGMIDGLGSSGRSFFATGVACTGFSCVVSAVFDFTATNGQYPTAVGVAWTDGSPIEEFRFRAYDSNDVSIGVLGPFHLGDDNSFGGTAEDRFLGVYHSSGISRIILTASDPLASFLEVDHVQYGRVVPEPNASSLLLASLGAIGAWKVRQRRRNCTKSRERIAILENLERRLVLSTLCASHSRDREAMVSPDLKAILADHVNDLLETSARGRGFLDNYAIERESLWVRAYVDPNCRLSSNDFSHAKVERWLEFNNAFAGKVDFDKVPLLTATPGVVYVEPILRPTLNAIHGQGDVSLRADDVRSRFSLDGSGVTVGVISDSFDKSGQANADKAAGELPMGAYAVHDDDDTGIDEGRAMMQIVHDIAPGAELIFSTGVPDEAAFSRAMDDLIGVDADVIVDDLTYWGSPFFQDGMPAQRVTSAVSGGVTYFTSAGNFGSFSRGDTFRPSSQSIAIGPTNYGVAHDFDSLTGPGHEDIFQSITVPADYGINIVLQWGEPFRNVSGGIGATNNLDLLVFFDPPTSPYPNYFVASTNLNNASGNAVESLVLHNQGAVPHTFYLAITRRAGNAANLPIKYIVKDFDQAATFEYAMNSPTIVGHANTANAAAVGAAYYHYGPDFSGNLSPHLQDYSSRGGTPILFNTQGGPINESRQQPMFVAPDGGNMSASLGTVGVDDSVQMLYAPNVLGDVIIPDDDPEPEELPNFFGTSAAAPHAAGVAALVKQAWPQATPAQIYDILKSTATD